MEKENILVIEWFQFSLFTSRSCADEFCFKKELKSFFFSRDVSGACINGSSGHRKKTDNNL